MLSALLGTLYNTFYTLSTAVALLISGGWSACVPLFSLCVEERTYIKMVDIGKLSCPNSLATSFGGPSLPLSLIHI